MITLKFLVIILSFDNSLKRKDLKTGEPNRQIFKIMKKIKNRRRNYIAVSKNRKSRAVMFFALSDLEEYDISCMFKEVCQVRIHIFTSIIA